MRRRERSDPSKSSNAPPAGPGGQGLADFAVVQSYLDTAHKWGIDKLDALRRLFTTGAWLPPALTPAE